MRLELPLVMDLVKAKIRLEESKTKAQKLAQANAAIAEGKSGQKRAVI